MSSSSTSMAKVPPKPPSRSPWQTVYSWLLQRRRSYWSARARRLPRPVLSVGNLHWGGGGKTPFAAALVEHLCQRGLRTALLSRGYRRKTKGTLVVSTGEGPLVDVKSSGDEPYELAVRLAGRSGSVIVVDSDRYRAGREALRGRDIDAFVLDDGFSHVRLHRDVEILVFPSHDPWGGSRLLPSGRLREPLATTRRAHAAVMTGALADASALARGLRLHGYDGPTFAAPARYELTNGANAEELATQPRADRRVVLVSGVANPGAVEDAARSLGLAPDPHLVFPDHHDYPARSIETIRRATRDLPIVTTAKDFAKLAGHFETPPTVLRLRCEPEPDLRNWLDERLDALTT